MSTDISASGNGLSASEDIETNVRRLKLYRAALCGDLNYRVHKDDITAKISMEGDTALHIAATAKSSDFAIALVRMMEKDDLANRNTNNNTAFCIAAAAGKLQLAKEMSDKNTDLANIQGGPNENMLPIYMAALFGHKEMVEYLCNITNNDGLNDINLFLSLIRNRLYDLALRLLEKYQELATCQENGEKALLALAQLPIDKQQGSWNTIKRCFNQCTNKKLPPPQPLELVKRIWKLVIRNNASSTIIKIGREPMFVAAAQGNIEFLTTLIPKYPDLILEEKNGYSIFHFAVKYRHWDIFQLIHEIGSIKDFIVEYKDKKDNNILHLAGKLAPSDQLNIVSGVALQLRQELLWFEEVKKIVQPWSVKEKNKQHKTPGHVFTKEHEALKKDGEQWMKDTANYCMIVAALITTVALAAAFTVPGGTKDETGAPLFLHKSSFKIFVVSDAISLVLSACSVLFFLSILTSRFAEEDFLSMLPRKLVLGLATLLLSIAAMMMVFCATIFIVFADGLLWVPILVTVIASFPVILFTIHQWILLFDVARSTIKGRSLLKPRKRLFYTKGKTVKPKMGSSSVALTIRTDV